jgi:sigma-B regulation protein RsbU (phosphoserine phosphatase)
LVSIDLAKGELRCCNAGHLSPYVMKRGELGTLEMPRGKPLGIRPDFAYTSSVHPLDGLDFVFLYTDGVTEAFNEGGELFSELRLENALRGVGPTDARGTVMAVVDEVRRFAGRCPQSDDIAALAVRFVDRSTLPPSVAGGSAPGSAP